jgi:hypothetical protein
MSIDATIKVLSTHAQTLEELLCHFNVLEAGRDTDDNSGLVEIRLGGVDTYYDDRVSGVLDALRRCDVSYSYSWSVGNRDDAGESLYWTDGEESRSSSWMGCEAGMVAIEAVRQALISGETAALELLDESERRFSGVPWNRVMH